jgi:hypothetical protein
MVEISNYQKKSKKYYVEQNSTWTTTLATVILTVCELRNSSSNNLQKRSKRSKINWLKQILLIRNKSKNLNPILTNYKELIPQYSQKCPPLGKTFAKKTRMINNDNRRVNNSIQSQSSYAFFAIYLNHNLEPTRMQTIWLLSPGTSCPPAFI